MSRAVYLDACCINRPFDDQSQPRVRLEAEAVLLTVALLTDARVDIEWLGSEVLSFELARMHDLDRLARVRLLASGIRRVVTSTPQSWLAARLWKQPDSSLTTPCTSPARSAAAPRHCSPATIACCGSRRACTGSSR